MFVGRLDEIRAIERCLFQTKHGNPQHFLIQGERGIGKTSLLTFVAEASCGNILGLSQQPFKFLTVWVDLGGCSNQIDIVGKLGRGLRTAITEQGHAREKAKDLLGWLTNWEALGVKYNKSDPNVDPEQIVEELVRRIAEYCNRIDDLDGIVFLIDEADNPSAEAGLGQLLKLLTERLARAKCERVMFGLAGLPSLLGRLRESHQSSPRLFQTTLLKPLEMDERAQVVEMGIKYANERNSVATAVSEGALRLLADLSDGYPHFVQQFAFSAFDHDSDNLIDDNDVADGAFKPDGALAQLGEKFFNEMYHARISSPDYRRVLDSMADHGDQWVSRKTIIAESAVSEANVGNALISLKAKSIIIQDDTRRGFYRLPTNSFAAWINAIREARSKSDLVGGDGL